MQMLKDMRLFVMSSTPDQQNKKNIFLTFNLNKESHKKAVDILNKCPKRGMTDFIINAVLAYDANSNNAEMIKQCVKEALQKFSLSPTLPDFKPAPISRQSSENSTIAENQNINQPEMPSSKITPSKKGKMMNFINNF